VKFVKKYPLRFANFSYLYFRALVSTSIAAYDKSGHGAERPMQCMEAIPSTGVSALMWAKHLSSDITKFHLNCSFDDMVSTRIKENTELNKLEGKVNLLPFDPFSVNNDHSFFNFV